MIAQPVQVVETGEVFPSISALARWLRTSHGNVCKVLNGRGRTLRGYHFKLVD